MTIQKESESQLPAADDGWWASLLADEESVYPSPEGNFPGDETSLTVKNNWGKAKSIFENDEIISLNVTAFNRGGILVEGEELNGFVPSSHLINIPSSLDENTREKLVSSYVGKSLKLKIIECIPEAGRVVFSERAALSVAGKRVELFKSIKPGQIVDGVVTNIKKFGAFVDLGGVEGWIHISEMSWGRVINPAEICKLGQCLQVLVLEVSPEKSRIALSIKRLIPNPWEEVGRKYSIDQVTDAKVTGLVPYGAFVRLEEGVEGLIHISEMTLKKDEKVDHLLQPDQIIHVRIKQIDAPHQRISLGLEK